jgi:hypothetical protein
MYKTLIVEAVTIAITAAALMTGIFATTLTQIALAQGNSTSPATSSNIQVLLLQTEREQTLLKVIF